MRVLNAMLGNGLGGIEFAFVNYAVALESAGTEVVCCVSPIARIKPSIPADIPTVTLAHCSQYDLFAIFRAARMLRQVKPDVVLVHGQRALVIFKLARLLACHSSKLVQVLHRPRFKNISSVDHTITVSKQLREQAIARGADAARVTHIPNFLLTPPAPAAVQTWRTPPVIGLLGRMVPEKGFDLFLDALAILKQRGVALNAVIGGDGGLREQLLTQARRLGLESEIVWFGWVEHLEVFYTQIDMLCVPSRAESFGLVVLEAFARGKPVISTATSGPSELITHGHNGMLCAIDAAALADALAVAIQNPLQTQQLAATATAENERYTLKIVAPKIVACLKGVLAGASPVAAG